METLEEATGANNNKDLSQIVKGKRTKRQRPQSPIPFTIATHSSSGDGSNVDCINVNNNIATSTNDSEDEYFLGTITEEDEDMAKCLILLARGRLQPSSIKIHDDQEQHEDYGTYNNNNKFTSKRYLENPTSESNGKAYVYECKTCGRTFASFQALGGHRASHKKPKNIAIMAEEKKMSDYNFLSSDEEEEPIFKNMMIRNNKRRRIPSQLSLEMSSNRGIMCSNPKVHECSYCGAEFNSGQALGGHMRRHRGEAIISGRNTINNNNLSFSALSLASLDQQESEELLAEAKRSNINLSLDLNLPAAPDDHNKFNSLDSKQKSQPEEEQQTALTLSTRRLIECQY